MQVACRPIPHFGSMTLTVSERCASRGILKLFPVKLQSLNRKTLLLKKWKACGLRLHTATSISISDSIASQQVCNSLLAGLSADEHRQPFCWPLWNRKRLWFCGLILLLECFFVGGIPTSNRREEGTQARQQWKVCPYVIA